jgi:hypothetical protein
VAVFSINEPPSLEALKAQLTPVITSLEPSSCEIGSADFTLVITGENFGDKSVIHFAGFDEPTTLNADGTISTGVKPSLWSSPAVVPVLVKNGPAASEALDFTFTAAGMQMQRQRQDYGVGRSAKGDERVDERR